MKKKLYIQDMVALALFYNYNATNSRVLSLDEILNFYKIVLCNLEELNFNILISYPLIDSKKIYSFYVDSTGKRFCKLNNDSDIKEILNEYIYIMPKDIILASKMNNALDAIGLEEINKSIKEKTYYKKKNY